MHAFNSFMQIGVSLKISFLWFSSSSQTKAGTIWRKVQALRVFYQFECRVQTVRLACVALRRELVFSVLRFSLQHLAGGMYRKR